MALTGMQIYKLLPKTNCKDCELPTCMAFAMQVAAKQKALTDCPHISEESKEELSEASSPPMKLVKIGPEGKQFEIGQETVMFRHDSFLPGVTGIGKLYISSPKFISAEGGQKRIVWMSKQLKEEIAERLKARAKEMGVPDLPDMIAATNSSGKG